MGPESTSPRLAAPLSVAIAWARSSAPPPFPGVPSWSPRIGTTSPQTRVSEGRVILALRDPPSPIHHQLRT